MDPIIIGGIAVVGAILLVAIVFKVSSAIKKLDTEELKRSAKKWFFFTLSVVVVAFIAYIILTRFVLTP